MKSLTRHISLTLKALRQARGWSLDKASEATGVSKAMLGQIEREESSPTIATLWKIASGFDTSFSSFIEEETQDRPAALLRRGEAAILHPKDQKIRVKTLFPYEPELGFETFLIELLPGCEHISPPHQEGVIEHIIVSEGEMEVLIDEDWQSLKKGEGLRFSADRVHGYRNQQSTIASFHDIIHYSSKIAN